MSRKKNKAPKKAKKSSASASTPRTATHQGDITPATTSCHGLSREALLDLANLPYDHRLVLAQDPNIIELAQTLRNLELGLIDRPTNQLFTEQYVAQRDIFADLELEPLKNDDTTFNRLAKGSDASDYRYNITKTLPTVIHDFIVAADLNPPSHYKDRKDTLPPAVVKRLAQEHPAPLFELPHQDKRGVHANSSSTHPKAFALELPVAQLQESMSAATTSATPVAPTLTPEPAQPTTENVTFPVDSEVTSVPQHATEPASSEPPSATDLIQVEASKVHLRELIQAEVTSPELNASANSTPFPAAPAEVANATAQPKLSQSDLTVPEVVLPDSCSTSNTNKVTDASYAETAAQSSAAPTSDLTHRVADRTPPADDFVPQESTSTPTQEQPTQPSAPATTPTPLRTVTLPVAQTPLAPRNHNSTPDETA